MEPQEQFVTAFVIILVTFLASLAFNFYLVYKLKFSKKRRPLSTSAEEFLSDIMRGDALVRVSRIAPQDVFLRSPR